MSSAQNKPCPIEMHVPLFHIECPSVNLSENAERVKWALLLENDLTNGILSRLKIIQDRAKLYASYYFHEIQCYVLRALACRSIKSKAEFVVSVWFKELWWSLDADAGWYFSTACAALLRWFNPPRIGGLRGGGRSHDLRFMGRAAALSAQYVYNCLEERTVTIRTVSVWRRTILM